jgi:hypothetical protein
MRSQLLCLLFSGAAVSALSCTAMAQQVLPQIDVTTSAAVPEGSTDAKLNAARKDIFTSIGANTTAIDEKNDSSASARR